MCVCVCVCRPCVLAIFLGVIAGRLANGQSGEACAQTADWTLLCCMDAQPLIFTVKGPDRFIGAVLTFSGYMQSI